MIRGVNCARGELIRSNLVQQFWYVA